MNERKVYLIGIASVIALVYGIVGEINSFPEFLLLFVGLIGTSTFGFLSIVLALLGRSERQSKKRSYEDLAALYATDQISQLEFELRTEELLRSEDSSLQRPTAGIG